MSSCTRCKRGLTDPISIKRGYGPVCWAKAQADKSKEEQIVNEWPLIMPKEAKEKARPPGGLKINY